MNRRTFLRTMPLLMTALSGVLTTGCGYTWRGEKGSLSEDSVLGDGSRTLRMNAVDQTTLYQWLPYLLRSLVRDDITARGLAKWVDSGPADYALTVRVNSFQIRSHGQYEARNQLFAATINMELIVYNGTTNTVAWQSGPILYSDNFETSDEESAIKEVIAMSVRRSIDLMQQRF